MTTANKKIRERGAQVCHHKRTIPYRKRVPRHSLTDLSNRIYLSEAARLKLRRLNFLCPPWWWFSTTTEYCQFPDHVSANCSTNSEKRRRVQLPVRWPINRLDCSFRIITYTHFWVFWIKLTFENLFDHSPGNWKLTSYYFVQTKSFSVDISYSLWMKVFMLIEGFLKLQ